MRRVLSLCRTSAMCMLFACVCLSIVGCSDDDDSSTESGGVSLLVGSWYDEYLQGGWDSYDVEETITFKEDGTGSWTKIYYYEGSSRVADRDRYTFTYEYNESIKALTICRSDNSVKQFKVKTLTINKLELVWADGSGTYGTFDRN